MKNMLLTIVMALVTTTFYGQDFATGGAAWYYHEEFAFSADINYIKFTSEKDTLISGEICKKITKRHKIDCNDRPETEYLYTRNDTVFFLDTIFNEFQILYDFNAIASDSWMIKLKDEMQDVDTLNIRVDSVSMTQINGQNLKVLYVTYDKDDENMPETYTSMIIERIGDVKYMFNWYPWSNMACDGNYTSGLRCYQDSSIGLYSTGIADSCDYVHTLTGINNVTPVSRFELYPNPAQNFVEINAKDDAKYTVTLFDLNGRLLITEKVYHSNIKLDLSTLEIGVYVMRLQNNNQIIGYKKLIKE